MTTFLTSDTHYYHNNVIEYSNRPFRDLEEMHDTLVNNWNTVVKKNDIVYHLGDFCLTTNVSQIQAILRRLNGKIRLIQGNHDKWVKKIDIIDPDRKIEWVKSYHQEKFTIGNIVYPVVMMHFPIHKWDKCHFGSYHFHGHSHGTIDSDNSNIRRYDVGVDANGATFTPISLEMAIDRMVYREAMIHHGVID